MSVYIITLNGICRTKIVANDDLLVQRCSLRIVLREFRLLKDMFFQTTVDLIKILICPKSGSTYARKS